MDWNGSVALVTGASSGIGRALALRMAVRGARIALVARSEGKLRELAEEIGNEKAAVFACDVTDRAAIAALPGRVVERFGRLDFLVNNAGVNHRGDIGEHDAEALAAILETNLVAPVLLTHAALPHLKRGATVLNMASLAGKVAIPHEATYCASKSGLRAFTRSLGYDFRERGIRVCAVNPGPVDTGFFEDLDAVPDVVFSQPISSAEDIADATMRLLDGDQVEIDVPAASGKLSTLAYLFPDLFMALRPMLDRRGAKNKKVFMARRGGK